MVNAFPLSASSTPARRRTDRLLACLAAEIERGIEVIRGLDEESYRRASLCSGSVGAQFRHNLDFLNAFLTAAGADRVDYNDRERDRVVEIDREYAIEKFLRVVGKLRELKKSDLERSVLVRSETGAALWHRSSLGRELEFVLSHTVHHHALIAEKLAANGDNAVRDFGVAPSTLEFWNRSR